jgi:hypothetical protein
MSLRKERKKKSVCAAPFKSKDSFLQRALNRQNFLKLAGKERRIWKEYYSPKMGST